MVRNCRSEAVGAVKEQDEANTLPHHRDPRVASLIGMLVECKDGRWIVHSLTEPHFFPAWISVLGFDWIWDDDRYKGAPYVFRDDEVRAQLISLIKDRMKTKTAAEWMHCYLAAGNVCGDVVQTTQEALRHPQLAATVATIEVDDPRLGRMLQIGPLAKVSAVGEKSKRSGARTEDLSAYRRGRYPASPSSKPPITTPHRSRPLC